MNLFVLDTDHFSLYLLGHPQVVQNVALNANQSLALTVITVEEQLAGWQRALRQATADLRRENIYRRLADTARGFAGWTILPFSIAAMNQSAIFLRSRLNVGGFDLKIASIALDFQGTIITRNARDFGRVPGLSVADWSV